MNVLHINQSDISGGAAIAGYRLHQGLLAQGINSRLLVGYPYTQDARIAAVPRQLWLENLIERITKRFGLNYLQFIASGTIAQHPFYQSADILNFHNLHSGYFSYLAIARLTARKPAILTLHDMWSFTGHCAYSAECDRWKIGCGHCPHPDAYPRIYRDGTHLEWCLKQWTYRRSNLTVVAPSRWLAEQAQQSVLSRFAVHHIPYGINTDQYRPYEQSQCRSKLGLPSNDYVILFAAQNLQTPRKGGDLLIKALQQLPTPLKQKTLLLMLGACDDLEAEWAFDSIGLKAIRLGYVQDDRTKAIAYSAADVVVFPTRADNLPLVIQESLACATPIASFNVGGVSDLVRPGITGYLAAANDPADLSHGIVQILQDKSLRDRLSGNCRRIAVNEYSSKLYASRYHDLYHQVLQAQRSL